MAEKKFFVDINLQGNKLVNPVVGSNASMTAEGSFQYNAGRLEYYNGSTVQEVANLNDIAAVTGGLILQGGYDAATNTPDIAADSSVLKGFFWVVTTAGSFLGEAVQVGDSIIAKQDNPGATAANWLILQGNVVIATDSVDGISRLATQAEADAGTEGGAVVITPATLQGKIDAQITPEINNKLPLAGGTMSGPINLDGNDLSNVGSFDVVVGALVDMNGAAVNNVATPVSGHQATNKTYVDNAALTAQTNAISDANTYTDAEVATRLPLAGGTMSGNIDMGNNDLNNVQYVSATGVATDQLISTTTPNIALGSNLDADNAQTIINLPAPTNGGDAANKDYVDNAASTAQSNAESFATNAANTAESDANAYTDAKTTEINILTSDWQSDTNDFYAVLNLPFANGKAIASFFIEDLSVEFGYYNNGGTSLVVRTNILPSSTVNARLQKIG